MATLNLSLPAPNQAVSHAISEGLTGFVLDFDLTSALIERVDNNLLVYFEDNNSSITLEGFYGVYSAEFMPEFVMEGEVITGEDFFAALSPELMPAAGNAEQAIDSNGGSFNNTNLHEVATGVTGSEGIEGGSSLERNSHLVEARTEVAANLPPIITSVVTLPVEEEVTAPGGSTGSVNTTTPQEDLEDSSAPDGSVAHVGVTESGVGRLNSDTLSNNPNQEYAGDLVAKGQVIVQDPENDTLHFEVVGGTSEYGTFTIDPDTGKFTFVLKDDAANSLNQNQNITQDFTVRVTDQAGNVVETKVVVNIQGTNDRPEVSFEGDTGLQENSDTVTTGIIDIVDADTDGDTFQEQNVKIDGQNVSKTNNTVIEGDYGTLTVHPDGSYTYELYTPADGAKYDKLANLTDGETKEESFDVSTEDIHGASSSKTLTFDIDGTNNSVTVQNPQLGGSTNPHTVFEANLQGGTDANSAELKSEGSLVIESLDGLSEISLNGNTLASYKDGKWTFENAEATGYGEIVIKNVIDNNDGTYTVEYEYTLKDSVDHESGDIASDNFDLTFKDVDGSEGSTGVHINIVDDAPESKGDVTSDMVTAGETSSTQEASAYFNKGSDSGNTTGLISEEYTVLDANTSSDNGDGTTTYEFDWGSVTMNNATGSFTTKPNNDTDEVEFEVQYQDGDGDKAQTTVSFEVDNKVSDITFDDIDNDTVPDNQLVTSDEDVADNQASDSGSFSFTSKDGVQSITINGEEVTFDANGKATVEGNHGNLELTLKGDDVNGYTVEYTYKQDTIKEHTTDGTQAESGDSFSIDGITNTNGTFSDYTNNGTQTAPSVEITIVDDVPVASNVTASEVATANEFATFDLDEAVDFGADGAGITDITFDGLTAGSPYELDGNTLTYNGEVVGTLTFDATTNQVKLDTTTRSEALNGVEMPAVEFGFTAYDSDGDSSTATGSMNVDFTFGDTSDGDSTEADVKVEITTDNNDGKISQADLDADNGEIRADITVGGDLPIGESTLTVKYGDEEQEFTVTKAEDGSITVSGEDGDITVKDGNTIEVAFPKQDGSDATISATITDTDGNFSSDEDTAAFEFKAPTITFGAEGTASDDSVVLDEANLSGGTDEGLTGDPDGMTSSESGKSFEVSVDGTLDYVTINGQDFNLDGTSVGTQNNTDVTITNVVITDNGNGNYTVSYDAVLNNTLDNAAGENSQSFDLEVSATGSNGMSSATSNIEVTVFDDAPVASNVTASEVATANEFATFDLDEAVDFGADGAGITDITFDGLTAGSPYELDGNTLTYNGEVVGTLTFDATTNQVKLDTTTRSEALNGVEMPAVEFGFTAYDSDGDSSTATGSMNVDFTFGDTSDGDSTEADVKVEITTDNNDGKISQADLDADNGEIRADITVGGDLPIGESTLTVKYGDEEQEFTVTKAEDGSITVSGEDGDITVKDGNTIEVAFPKQDGSDATISATITDTDGNFSSDEDTAAFEFKAPTITFGAEGTASDDSVVLDEANLSGGTDEGLTGDPDGMTSSESGKSFEVSVDGTLDYVTINGQDFNLDGTSVGTQNNTDVTITNVVITDNGNGNYTVSYDAVLNNTLDNAAGENSQSFDLEVSATGSNGMSSATSNIEVTVFDDAPVASVSGSTAPEINTNSEVTEFDLGEFGADEAASVDSVVLSVGEASGYELSENNDGSYTLTYGGKELGTVTVDGSQVKIDTSSKDSSFAGQELPQLSIDYTLKDSDGDTANSSFNADFDFKYGDTVGEGEEDATIGVEITTDENIKDDGVISQPELDLDDDNIKAEIVLGGELPKGETSILVVGDGESEQTFEVTTDENGNITSITKDGEDVEFKDNTIEVSFPKQENAEDVTITATITDEEGNTTSSEDSALIDTEIAPDLDDTANTVQSDDDAYAQDALVQGVELESDVNYDFSGQFEITQAGQTNPFGYFTSDADGNLFFTQTAPYVHPDNEGNADTSHTITVQVPVKDDAGNESYIEVQVEVGDSIVSLDSTLDDADITNAETSGGSLSFGSADGIKELTVNGEEITLNNDGSLKEQTVNLDNGQLKIEADGSYTFTPNEDFVGDVTLEFIATDNDGDTNTSSETITVIESNIAPEADNITLDVTDTEAGKTDTDDINATDANNDTLTYEIKGSTGDDLSEYGSLKNNNDGTFTFELNEDADDLLGEGDEFTAIYTVTVDDGNGGTKDVTITVNVTGNDDVPVKIDVDDSISQDITSHDSHVALNTDSDTTNDVAVQGNFHFTSVATPTSIVIAGVTFEITDNGDGTFSLSDKTVDGNYGNLSNVELTLNGDTYTVSYDYKQDTVLTHTEQGKGENVQANVESFTVKVNDADGGAGLETSINVNITDDAVEISSDTTGDYADPSATDQTITREVPTGWVTADGDFVHMGTTTLKYENVDTFEANTPKVSDDGILTSTTTGKLDVDASDATNPISFNIAADVKGTSNFLVIDGELVDISKAFVNEETGEITYLIGKLSDADGDGKAQNSNINDFAQEDLYAKVTFNPSTNEWTVEQYKEFDEPIVLEFSTTDKDGDSDDYTIAVNGTTEGFGANVMQSTEVIVDESDLVDGGVASAIGSVDLKSADGLGEIIVDGETLATWNEETNSWNMVENPAGNVTITSIEPNGTENGYTVTYEYELKSAIDGDAGKDANSAEEAANQTQHDNSFDMQIVDRGGDVTNTKIEVTVNDDAPEVQNDYAIAGTDSAGNHQGIIQFEFGADNGDGTSITLNGVTAEFNGTSWNFENGTSVIPTETGYTLDFDGVTLSTSNNSDWVLNAPKDSSSLELQVRDADGDVAQGTVNFVEPAAYRAVGGMSGVEETWTSGSDYNVSLFIDTSINACEAESVPFGESVHFVKTEIQDALENFIDNTLYTHSENPDTGGVVNLQLNTYSGSSTDRGAYATTHEFRIEGGTIYKKDAEGEFVEIYSSESTGTPADALIGSMEDIVDDQGRILKGGGAEALSSSEEARAHITDESYQGTADFFDANASSGAENKLFFVSGGDLVTSQAGGSTVVEQGSEKAVIFDIQNDSYRDGTESTYFEAALQFDISGRQPGDIWTSTGSYVSESDIVNGFDNVRDWGSDSDLYLLRLEQTADGDLYLSAVSQNPDRYDANANTGYGNMIKALGDGSITAAAFTSSEYSADTYLHAMNENYSGITQDIHVRTAADADKLFTPEAGNVSTNALPGSFTDTSGEGMSNDLILGSMTSEDIVNAVKDKLAIEGYEPSAEEAIQYVIENPEWFATVNNADGADGDIITAGEGGDIVYAQGGDDIVFGDGGMEVAAEFADHLGVDNFRAISSDEEATAEEVIELLTEIVSLGQTDGMGLADIAAELETDEAIGSDFLFGGEGNDIVLGLGGDDYLSGGSGDDILLGGSGDDYLVGGIGNDILVGGEGEDEFAWTTEGLDKEIDSTSHIADFDTEEDMLDLSAFSRDDYNITAQNTDAGAVITITHKDTSLGGSEVITLEDTEIDIEIENNTFIKL